jgi:hypothetical protein
MKSEDKPKPLLVRLPADVDQSLRFVAGQTRRTMNAVVTDCLRENLPAVSFADIAGFDGVPAMFARSPEELVTEAQARLNRYQAAMQMQISTLLEVVGALNAQVSSARDVQEQLRTGFVPRIASSVENLPVPKTTEQGLEAHDLLQHLHSSRVVKTEEFVRKARKTAAKHQFEAIAQWEFARELLDLHAKTSEAQDRPDAQAGA